MFLSLKGRVRKGDSEIFCVLAYSPNGPTARSGPAWSQELLADLLHGCRDPSIWAILLLSQAHQQVTELKVKQLGLELAPILDPSKWQLSVPHHSISPNHCLIMTGCLTISPKIIQNKMFLHTVNVIWLPSYLMTDDIPVGWLFADFQKWFAI